MMLILCFEHVLPSETGRRIGVASGTLLPITNAMRLFFTAAVFLLIISKSGHSQNSSEAAVDSALAKRISISGFCLCQTTVTDLRTLSGDLEEVSVEEMDTPKNCYAQDARYINGKGYFSRQYPGLIFQKEEGSDFISKIRLTREFKGRLPNGSTVELRDLKLRDLFNHYPGLKEKWGSRGCSEYWQFSNDTIAFFVKIDKKIQPQFPINKAFYLDQPVEAADFVFSCYRIRHKENKLVLFDPGEPMFFLDSIRVNKRFLTSAYEPGEFAFISVYRDAHAIELAGPEAKNGVIYITTKTAAWEKYWKFFKSKSPAYQKAVGSRKDETNVVYILNDKVLEKNFEADLFKIDDSSFLELSVIDKKDLKKTYKISDKKQGIVIKTKTK